MVDAIVLAGRPNTGLLQQCSPETSEALIDVNGRPMVQYVLDALIMARHVDKIALVGPVQDLAGRISFGRAKLVEKGRTAVENVLRGVEELKSRDKVLVCTSDIPLITGEVVDCFVEACAARDARLYYPVADKRSVEAAYPGAKRTFVRLKEGSFTGGNVFLVDPEVVLSKADLIEQMYAVRKDPFAQCRLLGWGFVARMLLGVLSIFEVERRVCELFDLEGAVVIMPDPEIGMDVDKPADLELVREFLGRAA